MQSATAPGPQSDINADFLGGPPQLFIPVGREQLIVLLEHGLTMESTVLDVGCGCLRGGRWIIPLVERGHYCGIEPSHHMLEKGLNQFVDPEIVRLKQPRFDHNDRFDFSVFDTKFTHFILRSIWSHTSKQQIETILDGMSAWGTQDAVLLASYYPASFFRRRPDYKGTDWLGRSHKSTTLGQIAHKFSWIRDAARRRGLTTQELDRPPLGDQVWLRVRRG